MTDIKNIRGENSSRDTLILLLNELVIGGNYRLKSMKIVKRKLKKGMVWFL